MQNKMPSNTINILLDLLDKFKLSQNQFALKIGVNRTTITEWLQGKYEPKIDKCYKIIDLAKQYGIELTLEMLKPR